MIEQNAFTIVFGIFLLFSCRDVFFGHSGHDSAQDSAVANEHLHRHHHHAGASMDEIGDMPHMAPGIPTIKIQYCHSCGYRQAFDEISKLLQMHYPEIKIDGDLHKPNWFKSQIVNLLFLTKIAVLAMIYMDINPFTYFRLETPRIWTYMSQSKVSSSLMILFIANSIESNMMSTGAFEIFYNDMPVWSKIQTGRMPTAPELLQIVQSHMSLGHKSRLGSFAAAQD